MQADAAGGSTVLIFDLVDRLQLIDSDDAPVMAAMLSRQPLKFDVSGSSETINANHILVLGSVARQVSIVMDSHIALRDRHPAKLPIVRVDSGLLPGLPADRHYLEEIILVNQIAGVILVAEKGILLQLFWSKTGSIHKLAHQFFSDQFSLEIPQAVDQIVD